MSKEGEELAEQYANQGYPVFPVRQNKQPYTQHGFKDASTDPEVIKRWWKKWPNAGVGISTGPAGIVVVDLDVKNGKDGLAEWQQFDVPASPYEVQTPSGGKHIWYRNDAQWTSSSDKLARGVDIRAHGGYVVAYGLPPAEELPALPLLAEANASTRSTTHRDRSSDDLDFPLTWDEILSPHGYEPCGGKDSWVRPGKDCADGHSINVWQEHPTMIRNFSGTEELPDKAYTRKGLYATLNGQDALDRLLAEHTTFPKRLNFKLAKEESANQEWIIENVIEKKQRVSVTAPAGAMKSLVLLNLAITLGLGLETLGNTPKEPVTVMYLDYENGADDILDRVESMGFTAEQLDSPDCKLHIIHMPDYGWLDKAAGGLKLTAHAKAIGAELVIIDTLSKVTQGEENANETYRDVMIYTSNVLQDEGISILFLDHTGHAGNRARGASAKPQNVDVSFVVTRGKGARDNEQYWDKRPESNGKDRTGRGLKLFTLKTDDSAGKLTVSLDTGSVGQNSLDIHAVALHWLRDHDLLKLGPRPMWTKAEGIPNRPVGKSALEKALKAWQDASSDEQFMFL